MYVVMDGMDVSFDGLSPFVGLSCLYVCGRLSGLSLPDCSDLFSIFAS